MDNARKYIWIALCSVLIIWHTYLLISLGNANNLRSGITVFNIFYIVIFLSAIFHELKVAKTLLYAFVISSLLVGIYGVLFTKIFI